MKTAISVVIILISLAGGMLFYFKGCSQGPSTETIAAIQKADSAQRLLDSARILGAKEISRLRQDSASTHNSFDSLRRRDSVMQVDLTARAAAVEDNLAAGDVAQAQADTSAIIQNWLSLRSQVREAVPIVQAHDSITEAEVNLCLRQALIADSTSRVWHGLYLHADTANTLQKQANVNLQKDLDRSKSAVKIWRPIAIGATAYAIVDFVIHSLKR